MREWGIYIERDILILVYLKARDPILNGEWEEGEEREKREGERAQDIQWAEQTSTPTNVSPLDPSRVNKPTEQRFSLSHKFKLPRTVDNTHSSRRHPVQGANHGQEAASVFMLS